MPATVQQRRGVVGGGHERGARQRAGGRASAKNARKRSRISSEVMVSEITGGFRPRRRMRSRLRALPGPRRRGRPGDRRVADDQLAVHQAGELARGDAVGGLGERQAQSVRRGRGGVQASGSLAVAQAHAVEARPVQHRVAQATVARRELPRAARP